MKSLSTFSVSASRCGSMIDLCTATDKKLLVFILFSLYVCPQLPDSSLLLSLQVCCRSRRLPQRLFKSAVSYCRHPTEDASSYYSVSCPGSARIHTCLHSMMLLLHAHWYSFSLLVFALLLWFSEVK